ncbi:Cyclin-dependent kinases regulatory subunit 1 [Hibiscus syriacus]|uniref:Cyclin-dependent kinases regulatory subunit n=1 Tax=Hibiscus syriacus TaxID=106335 RepID=A0A6A3AB68_HIBSY|nr:Cyclin-dependent kinases regulatory subunit 1 [Hibiscus syriacus]
MGQIQYSEKYFDDSYEYRHVVLPPEVAKLLPKIASSLKTNGVLLEYSRVVVGFITQFIALNHIMLFRRPLTISSNRRISPSKHACQVMLAASCHLYLAI